jgi:hypothetical protein
VPWQTKGALFRSFRYFGQLQGRFRDDELIQIDTLRLRFGSQNDVQRFGNAHDELAAARLVLRNDAISNSAAVVDHPLQIWNLRQLRTELARLGLDWSSADIRMDESKTTSPIRIELRLSHSSAPGRGPGTESWQPDQPVIIRPDDSAANTST